MDYTNFYLAIRRYVKGKITRGEFLIDWRAAQYGQGIKAAQPKRGLKERAMA